MMISLSEFLFIISTGCLIPVIVLLLLFFALTLAHMGGLLAEFIVRWKANGDFMRFVNELKTDPARKVSIEDIPKTVGLPKKAFRTNGIDRDKLLDDLQLESEKLLGRLMLGIRLGPILGLAGTLIPLGPALVALSSGDIETLSEKLVVAFATTVLGLLIGGICFAMHSVRRRWYMQDLNDIEFIMRKME